MVQLKDRILNLLTNYIDDKRRLSLLKFEQVHPPKLNESDMIEGMMLGRNGDDQHCSSMGHISDKTYYVAMNYRQYSANLKQEYITDLSQQVYLLEQKLGRLDNCLSQLPCIQSQVLIGIFEEDKKIGELVEELEVSESTVSAQ